MHEVATASHARLLLPRHPPQRARRTPHTARRASPPQWRCLSPPLCPPAPRTRAHPPLRKGRLSLQTRPQQRRRPRSHPYPLPHRWCGDAGRPACPLLPIPPRRPRLLAAHPPRTYSAIPLPPPARPRRSSLLPGRWPPPPPPPQPPSNVTNWLPWKTPSDARLPASLHPTRQSAMSTTSTKRKERGPNDRTVGG